MAVLCKDDGWSTKLVSVYPPSYSLVYPPLFSPVAPPCADTTGMHVVATISHQQVVYLISLGQSDWQQAAVTGGL